MQASNLLRLLFVEDLPSDVELAERALRQAGLRFSSETVETEQDFLHALKNLRPDLVISDYALPAFDGMRALQLSLAHDRSLPFIIVTGSMNEETAVECMKAGATDYVIKEHIGKLPLAVHSALEQKKMAAARARTELALRESEARYKSLFQNSHAVMLIIDPGTFEIVDANPAACAYYGWSKEELCRMRLDAINTLSIDQLHAKMQRAHAEKRYYFVFKHRRADGTVRDVEIYSGPIEIDGRELFYSIVHDITDRVHAEEQVRLNESRLQSLLRISQYDADDVQDLLDYALGEAVRLTNSEIGYIYHYDEEQRLFTLNTWSEGVMDECAVIEPRTTYELDKTGIWGEAVRQRQPIIVNDFQAPNPLKKGYPEGHVELNKFLTIPVFRGDTIIAVVGVGNRAADYTQTDVLQLSLLMDSVWKIVDRKHAETALQASEEKYCQIVETAQEGIWIIDADNRTTFVNTQMAGMLGYTVKEMMGQSLFGFMDETRQAQATINLEHGKLGLHERHEFAFQRKDGSVLWTLLSAGPLFDSSGQYSGAQAMIADITDLKQSQQAELEQKSLAQALAHTANALISALDLDTVMNTILEYIGPVVPHDACNIMLIEDDEVYVAYWAGYFPEKTSFLESFRLGLDQMPNLNHMQETGQAYWVSETETYEGWFRHPATEWIKSHLAAPIRSQGQVIGFLNVDSSVPGFYDETDAKRLQAFADQASLAIEHAQLYEQIQRHVAELEQRVIERTAQLNHAKERIEAILNSTNDVMILCRKDGRIDQVNPAFDAAFECAPDEVIGRPMVMLAATEDRSKIKQAFAQVVDHRQSRRLEITVHCKQRNIFEADVILSPIVEENNTLLGVVCSLRDMTQRKQVEAQLRQMLKQAMELSELRARYVSMAAHDLRNPLAVIQTSANLIHRYGHRLTAEDIDDKFTDIQSSIKVMVEMLDDILTLGRAESGKLACNPEPLDVIELCQRIRTEVRQAMGGAPAIRFDSDAACTMAQLDPKLMRHILNNLLTNAIKYSPDDQPVTLRVRCQPQQITFEVQDQGIGIPEADQHHMFEAFHRASNAKSFPGTGLGLAIVRQSVELHGGSIMFESTENVGTTFTVAIPQPSNEPAADSL